MLAFDVCRGGVVGLGVVLLAEGALAVTSGFLGDGKGSTVMPFGCKRDARFADTALMGLLSAAFRGAIFLLFVGVNVGVASEEPE